MMPGLANLSNNILSKFLVPHSTTFEAFRWKSKRPTITCTSEDKRAMKKDLVPKKLETPEEEIARMLSKQLISVDKPPHVALINGIPVEHAERTVKIARPEKNAMQSGTHNLNHWEVTFDTRERWESSNLGWCASGDALSNTCLRFATKEDAIAFCDKNGWGWYVLSSPLKKPPKPKSYGDNYSANRRCRVSTK